MSSGLDAAKKKRIVIVGGGLAGLAAGEAIASVAGDRCDITILEAKRTFGGRAGSFIDPTTGEAVDYCQHVAMGCCTNFLKLLDRCGLSDGLRRYRELLFLHPEHPPSRFVPSRFLPAPLHLASTVGSLRYLNADQKKRVRHGLWALMRLPPKTLASGAASNDQTAGDWLRRHYQDTETMTRFWDVILVSALGERTDRVSIAAARKVIIDGFAGARGASDVYVPARPLSELIGTQLSRAVESKGVRLLTNCLATKIDSGPDARGTATIETLKHGTLDASHVIVAVPWFRIESLFAQSGAASALPNIDRWADFPTSPITGIHLWLDREITHSPHAVLVGTTAQWLFRSPIPQAALAGRHYYQVVISASHRAGSLGNNALVKKIMDELRQVFPKAVNAKLLANRIVTDPRSVYSLTPAVDRLRPPSQTALPWLHLAGDWIATGWPATMEGAVISGRMAADSVLRQLGLPASTIDPGLPRGWLARQLIR